MSAPRPSFFYHLHPPTIPAGEARFRHTFGLGGLSLFLFLVLALTGALEMFYYIPSLDGANASVKAIAYLAPFGWLVRNLHFWSAQAMVVVVTLHMLRVILTGSYKKPRRFNYLLGLSLLAFTLLLDFTGYALRWDEDIHWALVVGTNLLKEIPAIGHTLYAIAVGGNEIGASTVVRLYGWHVFGLALPAFAIIVWHAFRVRRDGGIAHRTPNSKPQTSNSNPADSARSAVKLDRIDRAELVRREVLATLIALAALILLSVLFDAHIGLPADPGATVAEATAPWFFIWIQELL
ncbi:MAG: cytochrome b N-terminal domain-containing protein, partial [Chloroflexi bacterium]|nr:cytochrome b N-terminal domain-containing protein [Chloroflexota bacterium]